MSEESGARRYLRAKRIALEALELDMSERQAFIDRRCGDDSGLRDEVLWLIDAAENPDDDEVPEHFQAATRSALKEVSLEVPLPRNYRLIRRLDQGGMGIVYLAARVDGEIRQRVALKLLHLDATPEESLVRRFATEQQILSRLSHPNIAHLIDAGVTAEGRPFMATEYVDGERIDHWCSRHRSPVRERLDLFLKVCAAVDYAHRHMVIHRDIKPANVLVTPQGEPKLLDFGIARLLDAPERLESAEPARGEALTMAYASPEQVTGEGLGAASDVYSLGVVLYELLASGQPFEHVRDQEALRRAILEGDFPSPRRRAADGPPVPRDLDAIVMKAMANRAERRYASVEALASDVRRFLEHRPVRARGDDMLYRSRRFVRRHRWAVAAGVAAAAMLVAYFVEREMQLERIAWERDRAEAVTEFMNEMFAGADSLPSRGSEVTVREILDLGAGQLSNAEDDSPAVLGSIYLTIGQAYNALGLGEKALPLLEEARAALSPSLPVGQRALIQAEVGAALDSGGRAVEAITADETAIELFERAPGDFSEEILRVRIRKLRNHANVLDLPLEETVSALEDLVAEIEADAGMPRELLFEAKAALAGAHVVAQDSRLALETALE
ncbi:MAG: serine/threonine-protein kinase, partial [Wenzhouxiangella sp.]